LDTIHSPEQFSLEIKPTRYLSVGIQVRSTILVRPELFRHTNLKSRYWDSCRAS